MASFFDKLRAGLSKTAQQIRERLNEVTGDAPPETAPAPAATTKSAPVVERADITLQGVEDALLGADVGLAGTERILAALKQEKQGTLRERVGRVIYHVLTNVPSPTAIGVKPHVVLVVGVNGTGKTTTVGKLAHLYRSQGQSVMVCAADTFRAAA